MYSLLLVLCVTSGLVRAAPGVIGGYGPAVSHVSRVDIHKPILTGYETPIVGLPHYGYGHYPIAHSYSNRIDIHSPTYVKSLGYEHGYGYGHGGYIHGNLGHALGLHDGSGYGYAVHGYGVQGLHHGY